MISTSTSSYMLVGHKHKKKNALDLLNILVHSKEECVPLVDLEQNLESERTEIILHQGNQ